MKDEENIWIQWQIDGETKQGIDKSRKEGGSCVKDGVNDFGSDILKGSDIWSFSV